MIEKLLKAAKNVRENAHAPYSKFKVGAAVLASNGKTYVGCNVENVAYPEGTCAEAGAIAAMCADGVYQIKGIAVITGSTTPSPPCGGCRQKIAEFAAGDVHVTMATTGGVVETASVSTLLPGAFDVNHLNSGV